MNNFLFLITCWLPIYYISTVSSRQKQCDVINKVVIKQLIQKCYKKFGEFLKKEKLLTTRRFRDIELFR